MKITQEGVEPLFKMRVPVYLELRWQISQV